jgi:4-hydroxybenzoate polyprenyltransferase
MIMGALTVMIIRMLSVSRILFWAIFPIVFFLGLVFAKGSLTLQAALLALAFTLPVGLAGYGINDVYDFQSDRKNPRKKVRSGVEGRIVTPKDRAMVKKGAFAAVVPFALALLYTMNPTVIFLGAAFILVGYAYSAPPLRLKGRPPLDSLSNGLIYFLFPFLMGYYLPQEFAIFPTFSLWIALCVSMIHAVGTVVDYDADKKAGLDTFAIRFGKRTTMVASSFSFLLAIAFDKFTLPVVAYLSYCALVCSVGTVNTKYAHAAIRLIFAGFLIAASYYIIIHASLP